LVVGDLGSLQHKEFHESYQNRSLRVGFFAEPLVLGTFLRLTEVFSRFLSRRAEYHGGTV
jgi:hypothetical protein